MSEPAFTRLPGRTRRPGRLTEQAGLRTIMGRFATGITVLTAAGEHGHGMTANAFSSVSLEPPLVLCCVSRAARMHSAILAVQSFGVSILGADQRELARYFADWRRPSGQAQFDEVDCTPGEKTGAPLLDGSIAWLECTLRHTYEGGDHSIFVGEVVSCLRGSDEQDSLVFYGGGYHQIAESARAA